MNPDKHTFGIKRKGNQRMRLLFIMIHGLLLYQSSRLLRLLINYNHVSYIELIYFENPINKGINADAAAPLEYMVCHPWSGVVGGEET